MDMETYFIITSLMLSVILLKKNLSTYKKSHMFSRLEDRLDNTFLNCFCLLTVVYTFQICTYFFCIISLVNSILCITLFMKNFRGKK